MHGRTPNPAADARRAALLDAVLSGRLRISGAATDETDGDDDTLAGLVALVEQAEGDLSGLSAEFDDDGNLVGGDLFTLRQGLVQGYDDARPGVSTSEELAALRRVQEAIAAVDARTAAVVQENEALAADLAALDAAVHGEPEAAADDAEGDEDPAGDEGTEGDEPAEPETTEADESEAAADEPASGTEQIAAGASPRSTPASLSRLRRSGRGRRASAPTPDAAQMRRVLAFAGLQNVGAGGAFPNYDALGAEIASLAGTMSVSAPSGRKHYVGKIPVQAGEGSRIVLASEHSGLDDEGLIDLAVRRNREVRQQALTLQASGGPCMPPQIDYSMGLIGDRGTPFVGSLPSIASDRGISFFPWIEFDMATVPLTSGVGFVTAAQDTAGYGGTNPITGEAVPIPSGGAKFKDCIRIDCPEPVDCGMEMVYRCVTVGRFMAQAAKEYVRLFDEFVGIYFDVARDERAISKILAAAKVIPAGPATFGSSVDLLSKMRQLAAHIRSARHAPNLVIHFSLPEWNKYRLANDIASAWANGSDNLRVTPDQALALLALDEGIDVGTYNVHAGTTLGGSPTVLPLPEDGSPLPEFPNEVRILAWADGAVFRRQGSEVAFGLQEVGMHTNDTAAFEEVEENTCVRSSDVYALDVEVCDSGARGAAVVKTCGAQPGTINEVQWFDPGNATGGTVSVSFDGAGPVEVPFNASGTAATALLESLSTIADGDVSVTKDGTRFLVQFRQGLGGRNVPTLVVDDANLTGGAATATSGTLIVGG